MNHLIGQKNFLCTYEKTHNIITMFKFQFIEVNFSKKITSTTFTTMQQYNMVKLSCLAHLKHCNNCFTHNICDNSSISNSNSMDIALQNSIFSMDIITNGRGEGQKQQEYLMLMELKLESKGTSNHKIQKSTQWQNV